MAAKHRIAPPRVAPASGRPGAELIAERSITLVRDTSGLLPLKTRKIKAVVVTDQREDNPLAEAQRLLDATDEDNHDVLVLLLALRPISGAGRITVPEHARKLAAQHAERTIAVSFGSPYILRELGVVSTFVCAWGIQPVLQRAAIRAIRGEAPMTGRLPVTL